MKNNRISLTEFNNGEQENHKKRHPFDGGTDEENPTLRLLNRPSTVSCIDIEKWNNYLRYQNRLFLPLIAQLIPAIIHKEIPKRSARLFQKGSGHTFALLTNKAIGSLQLTFGTVWPVIFYIALFNDWRLYNANSDLQYGTSSADIFLGDASNQLTLSTNWGSDIPGNHAFKAGLGLMIALPIAASIVWSFIHLMWKNPYLKTDKNLQDYFDTKPWVFIYGMLRRLEWELLWNADIRDPDRKQMFETLKEYTSPYSFMRMRVASAFAKIIAGTYVKKDSGLTTLIEMHEAAVIKLKEFITDDPNLIVRLYAQYKLWQVGYSRNPAMHVVFEVGFLLITIMQAFAFARYLEVVVKKSHELKTFNDNKETCETKKHELWRYVPEIGNYDCVVCDWPMVYLRDKYTAQGCLDGLLRSQDDISPYLKRLKEIVKYGEGIESIDMSSRKIADWEEEKLKLFLDVFSPLPSLQLFNASSAIPNTIWPNDKKIEYLNQFFRTKTIHSLDMSGQNLGASNFYNLLKTSDGWICAPYLDVTDNKLGDLGFSYLKSVTEYCKVGTLAASYNGVTPRGIFQFSSNLTTPMLDELYLRGANVDQASFETVVESVSQNKIKVFDISFSDLTGIDMGNFDQKSSGCALETFEMEGCFLTDNQVNKMGPSFKNIPFKKVGVANNAFNSWGGTSLIYNVQYTTITSLNLRGNHLDDDFIENVIPMLPDLKIEHLDLSNCPISPEAFNSLIDNLPPTLKYLNLSDTQFDDINLEQLIIALLTKLKNLESLVLNSTKITDLGIEKLAEKIIKINYPLRALYVRRAQITNKGLGFLSQALPGNSFLTILDISGINADSVGGAALAQALSKQNALQELYMDDVPWGSAGIAVAQRLITPIDNMDYLDRPTISLDQKRKLAEAKPNTFLTTLSMRNCNLTVETARTLCRVLPRTHIAIDHFYVAGNSFDENPCTSSSNHLKPWLNLSLFTKTFELIKNIFTFDTAESKQHSFKMEASGNASLISRTSFFSNSVDSRCLMPRSQSQPSLNPLIPDISGVIYLSVYLLNFMGALVSNSSHQVHFLSENEKIVLKKLQQNLARISQDLAAQQKSNLGQSGLVTDNLQHCQKTLSVCAKTLKTALHYNQISESTLQDLVQQTSRMQNLIHRHAVQNRQFKNITVKERRVERRHLKTGKTSHAIIRHDIVTGKLESTVMSRPRVTEPSSPISFFGRVSQLFDFWNPQPKTQRFAEEDSCNFSFKH
ncbi:MAG: hypothetical protein H0U71_09875 [Gammaproteobacteria bacterium]|nr:hypothetical protein [Gammaproteobacteria bacterium]